LKRTVKLLPFDLCHLPFAFALYRLVQGFALKSRPDQIGALPNSFTHRVIERLGRSPWAFEPGSSLIAREF